MDKFNFDAKVNALERNHALFKRLLSMSIVVNVFLLIIMMMSINKEKIILIPQVAPENKLWVSQSEVSNNYLSTLSRNVMDLMLNVSPQNVDAQHEAVLKVVGSKYVGALKTKLANISKLIKENNISQNFYISGIKIIHDKRVVYINGSLNEYIYSSQIILRN